MIVATSGKLDNERPVASSALSTGLLVHRYSTLRVYELSPTLLMTFTFAAKFIMLAFIMDMYRAWLPPPLGMGRIPSPSVCQPRRSASRTRPCAVAQLAISVRARRPSCCEHCRHAYRRCVP